MSMLTDKEQKELLSELYDTSKRISRTVVDAVRRAFRESQAEQERAENERRKADRRKQGEGVKRGVMQILKAIFED